ncbi:MFS transporter [Promethearchaeum syntrophicum]|uniref:MFS transporter n=1 Tax=Promethearchaeum syntrophicum TaxID=2594042 RepID=A0A5B9D9G9_9ARCH|nr:MFS transporter [Candidatus Prometheoarchaeum syntrophicum]QEE15898.1 melibiose:sodium symporter [Candidatus Prometheoarchaeum syntrophicum]
MSDVQIENKNDLKFDYSRWTHISFGARDLFSQWHTAAFGAYTIFFYESVIGLSGGYAIAAFLIFAIWNAINDPLMGYLMEKFIMPWEKKWGFRRFPWIIIGSVAFIFSYLIIFLVPSGWFGTEALVEANKWKLFAWYVISLLIYDTTFTIFDINAQSLFPEKFPKAYERRVVTGWGTFLGILGLVMAFVLTGLIVDQNFPETYRTGALFTFGFAFLFLILFLPGVFENKKMRERYKRREGVKGQADEPFFKVAKDILTDRTMSMKILFYFGYQAAVALINASALYIVTYILDDPENESFIFIMGGMLAGALISTPLWVIISQRVNNNKKMCIIAGFLMFATFIPMIFINGLIPWVICIFLFGISLGGQWFINPPTMGDVLDSVAVKTGKREQSLYYGFQTFVIRFGEAFKAFVIAIAHLATGFIEGNPTLEDMTNSVENIDLVLFGIRIHTAIVPALLVLVCTLLFWKYYDLTPNKVEANRLKLDEMGI